MFRRNGGRTISRYKKAGGTLKALKKLPFTVGKYKALEPRFDKTLGRVVYPVKFGAKTKNYFTAEKQAWFMIRRQQEMARQQKEDQHLYDHFEKQRQEKEKAAKARKTKKNPSTDHEERLMDFLRNGGMDDLFEEDYDVVPKRRRK